MAAGGVLKTVAPRQGIIETVDGKAVAADFSFLTSASVLFDAVYVPGGTASVETLSGDADAYHFIDEAYKHCKAIAGVGEAAEFISTTFARNSEDDDAVILGVDAKSTAQQFIK